jgi:phosphoribosylformimino-5-aminoimidazole carboxamide ribotide isomerase
LSTFELLPAIDLRGGRVVRLQQGDFARETSYGTDPLKVAADFAAADATWLHVVDLDGARAGEPRQTALLAAIVDAVGHRVRVEAGGGLRTIGAITLALEAGAARVAVGTALLRDPALAGTLVARVGPSRLAASIDVRDGLAVGDGWRPGASGLEAAEAIAMLAAAGIATFEVTAIDRDGLLGGPDLDLLRSLADLGLGRIIASGGVASIDDVLAVRSAGCDGAIVGRALYEGRVGLAELAAALGAPSGRTPTPRGARGAGSAAASPGDDH